MNGHLKIQCTVAYSTCSVQNDICNLEIKYVSYTYYIPESNLLVEAINMN